MYDACPRAHLRYRTQASTFRLASGMDFTDLTVFLSKIRHDCGAIPTRSAQDVPRVFTRLYGEVNVHRVSQFASCRSRLSFASVLSLLTSLAYRPASCRVPLRLKISSMAPCPTFLSAFPVTGCRALAAGVGVPAGWAKVFVQKQSEVHPKDPVFFSAAGLPSAPPASPFVVTSRRATPAWRNTTGSAGHLADRSGFFTAFP